MSPRRKLRARVATRRKSKASPRRRRSADEARREILDAAERHLRSVGPDALRLQDLARDIGISHPAILHHFGSREALIEAVVRRAFESLEAELVREFRAPEVGPVETSELLDRVFRTLGDRGFARLLAWLVLSERTPAEDEGDPDRLLFMVAQAAHAHRVLHRDGTRVPFEDTQFSILLAALALFGDAIAGDLMRRSAGLGDDPRAGRRFRRWLAELLVEHVDTRR